MRTTALASLPPWIGYFAPHLADHRSQKSSTKGVWAGSVGLGAAFFLEDFRAAEEVLVVLLVVILIAVTSDRYMRSLMTGIGSALWSHLTGISGAKRVGSGLSRSSICSKHSSIHG